jgi:hypothetical protein
LAVAAPLPNGQVLIAGGRNLSGVLQSAELFDPSTGTFTALPASSELQNPRQQAAAVLLDNGQVLIAGGDTGSSFLPGAELFWSSPQAQAADGDFGDQTVAQQSAAQTEQVTNVGAQALSIDGASLAGTNPSDFTITADGCASTTLAFGQSCAITVRFTPSAAGTRSATIVLQDNESTPTSITLAGTGVAANSDPTDPTGPTGPAGPTDPTGAQGSSGANGSNGTQDPTGAQAPSRKIEIVTCKQTSVTVNHKRKLITKCTMRLVSGAIADETTSNAAASLNRGRVVYATGVLINRGHGGSELILIPRRALSAGQYTLISRAKIGKRIVLRRTQIRIG